MYASPKWDNVIFLNQNVILIDNFRGQESAGIVTSLGMKNSKYRQKKGMGMVNGIFHEEELLKLRGNLGIGK